MNRKTHGVEGQAMLEFAATIPIMILILMALVDGSTVIRTSMACRTAAEEGARIASIDPDAATGDTRGLIEAVKSSVKGSPGGDIDVSIETKSVQPVTYTKVVPDSGKPPLPVSRPKTIVKITCSRTVDTGFWHIIGKPTVKVQESAVATCIGRAS